VIHTMQHGCTVRNRRHSVECVLRPRYIEVGTVAQCRYRWADHNSISAS